MECGKCLPRLGLVAGCCVRAAVTKQAQTTTTRMLMRFMISSMNEARGGPLTRGKPVPPANSDVTRSIFAPALTPEGSI